MIMSQKTNHKRYSILRALVLILMFTSAITGGAQSEKDSSDSSSENTVIEKFEKKGKFGLRNKSTGKVILKPDYCEISDIKGNWGILKKEDKRTHKRKFGIYKSNGALLTECHFDSISDLKQYKDNKWRFYGWFDGEKYLFKLGNGVSIYSKSPIYDFRVSKNGLLCLEFGKKEKHKQWILLNEEKNILFDKIDFLKHLDNGGYVFHRDYDKYYTLIDNVGKVIGEKNFSEATKTAQLPTYINLSHKVGDLYEGEYTNSIGIGGTSVLYYTDKTVSGFMRPGYIIRNGKKLYGVTYINTESGRLSVVVPFKYSYLKLSSRLLKNTRKYEQDLTTVITIDTPEKLEDAAIRGLLQLEPYVETFVNGSSRKFYNSEKGLLSEKDDPERAPDEIRKGDWEIFRKGNLYGLRTTSGITHLQPIYNKIADNEMSGVYYNYVPSSGIFWVTQGGKRGIYNAKLKKFIVPVNDWKYLESDYSFKGYKATASNGSDYIFLTNGTTIPGSFERTVRVLEHGTAVKRNGKWGYINKNGKMVIPCKYRNFAYDYIGWSSKLIFYNQTAGTTTYFLYDYKGNLVVSKSFKDYQGYSEHQFIQKYCGR